MTIQIRLFAVLREKAGRADLVLDLPPGSSVTDAASALQQKIPAIGAVLDRAAFAVNQSYVDRGTVLKDGDELALIPPVSGGSGE
jgi:molybdopterin synthase catalytic subunit